MIGAAANRVVGCFRVGVPLVGYDTADPFCSVDAIRSALLQQLSKKDVAVIRWDCSAGFSTGEDNLSKQRLANLGSGEDFAGNPAYALKECMRFDRRTVVVFFNIHRFLDDIQVVQAISNLRNHCKVNQKTIVLMGTGIRLPAELQNDVVMVEESLPTPDELLNVIVPLFASANLPMPEEEVLDSASRAGVGVTSFAAENLASLAMSKEGLDVDGLWLNKAKKINQTPGLKVVSSGNFDSIGGVPVVKDFMRCVLKGKNKPNCIVYIDEFEKAFAGLAGDTSGTTQDQLGVILQWMQDKRATGVIFYGPAGAAKSAVAKASGKEGGIPTIQLDLGAAKGSLVGQSESQIREALKVVDAVSGGKTLWIATCNSMVVLPPELRRRFKLGTWFFDLPDLEERRSIWQIYAEKFGFEEADYIDLLGESWTGAEIETCCELAETTGQSLEHASNFIVPVSRHSADQIAALREHANGRFLSASFPGVFSKAAKDESFARVFE